MGFWNDGIRPSSPTRASRSSHSRKQSRSRSRSSSRSRQRRHSKSRSEGGERGSIYGRPEYSRSASSFLSNLTGYNSKSANYTARSTNRGWFGGNSRPGHSRAQPRSGFIARIRKFLRDVYYYMRKHPMKVFVLVIMPLLTGGALTKLLGQFGVRLPRGLESMMGGPPSGVGGMGRGSGGNDRFYARGGARDFEGGTGLPGMASGGGGGPGLASSVQGLMGIAKMFV